jgi:hypothetical protein
LISGAPPVEAVPMLIVSGVAAAVMAVGALILRGDPDEDDDDGRGGDDLNVRAVLLDTAADAAAAGSVAISGAIILAVHGGYWLDPAVALAIAVIITYYSRQSVPERDTTVLDPIHLGRWGCSAFAPSGVGSAVRFTTTTRTDAMHIGPYPGQRGGFLA